MTKIGLTWMLVLFYANGSKCPMTYIAKDMVDYLQCQICYTPELSGTVEDSCCQYETVDKAQDMHFHPILQEISRLTFFRYFKINLGKECPYWEEQGMCSSRECAVCECDETEIPKPWYKHDIRKRKQKQLYDQPACDEQKGTGDLSKIERSNAAVGETFHEWHEKSDETLWIDQNDDQDMVYINLLENPERFTGYSGPLAAQIWAAIYNENCFQSLLNDMCLEERVFYRLISGLQTSVNTHIAQEYKFSSGYWGVNTALYVERVGKHPDRLANLYFTYLFVIRAVARAKRVLLEYDYTTGNDSDDDRTRELIGKLVSVDHLNSQCPSEGQAVLKGFDENQLFHVDPSGLSPFQLEKTRIAQQELEFQLRSKFQNISRIMDCVACEKCRLWGKLQIMGIGTAIKINLADSVEDLPPLNRNEVIALINVLTRLSESVDAVRLFRELEFQDALMWVYRIIAFAAFVALGVIGLNRTRQWRRKID